MNTFERIYQTEAERESDVVRENISMALTDQEYLLRCRRDQHAINMGMYRKMPEIELNETHAEETDEKSTRKSTPRKSKKDHRKSHAPAVESVQAEL